MSEPSPATGDGLGRRAVRGGVTTLAGQGARVLVQMVSVVVLARLLAPSDYGLMAMVLVIVGVAEVVRDFGLSSAAIQARTLSRGQRDNLFWINAAIGLALSLVMTAAAPLIAAVFGQPRLVHLCMAVAWVFLLNGLSTQYRASLNRQLRFGRLVVADISSVLVGLAAAVVLAVGGAGYWALAAQQLVAAGTMAIMVVLGAGWLPGRPDRNEPMGTFFKFGGGLVGSQLITYFSGNIDTLVIGLRFSPTELGLYTRAFQLLMLPLNQVRAPVSRVAIPVLSRVQDDDARYQAFLSRGQLGLGYAVLPALGVVVGAAAPVTGLMLGSQWEAVAPILALIATAGGLQMLSFVGYWAYVSKGLTLDLLHYSWVSAAIRVVCVLVGSLWGVTGVAAGYAAASAIAWPVSLYWVSRKAGLAKRPLYLGATRILGVAGLVAAAASSYRLVDGPVGVQVAVAVVAGFAALAISAVVPAVRADLTQLWQTLRSARERS